MPPESRTRPPRWALLAFVLLLGGTYLAVDRRSGAAGHAGIGAGVGAAVTEALGETAEPERVTDPAGILSGGDRGRMESYLGWIADETAIDIRLLFESPSGGRPLDVFAAEEATRLGIGRENGLRGILVAYDPVAERMRLELGYGLEEYFPDAFVGGLLEDQVQWYFQAGDPARLHLMLRILHWRIRDHMLGGRFDPTDAGRGTGAAFVSGGAGASARVPAPGSDPGRVGSMGGFRDPLPEAVRSRFQAGPTPEATYRRYLEWLALGRLDPDVGILASSARSHMTAPAMTPPFLEFIRWGMENEAYRIEERGDRAILYFTSTPLRSPLFLVRSEHGWQIDILEEIRCSREFAGHHMTWTLLPGCRGLDGFMDLTVELWSGMVRMRDGDNRPLPTPQWTERTAESADRVRRRPGSLLEAPSLPDGDEFGYPPARVGKPEIIGLLRARRWDDLEARLDSLNRLALTDIRYEYHVLDAYRTFEHPEISYLLDEWRVARPESPEARIAAARYWFERSWDARGTGFARETPDAAFREMRLYVRMAHEELDAALDLDSAQPVAYELRIALHQLDGNDRGAKRALAQGLAIAPLSVMLREARIRLLWPRWGGSLRAIARVAEDARPYMDANPRLRTLLGQADMVRAYNLDGEDAILMFDRALTRGSQFQMLRYRGREHRRARDYERAVADLDRAWMLRPERVDVLQDRAAALYWLARRTARDQREPLLERAEADASLAQQLRPDDEDNDQLLGWIRQCRAWPEGCD